MASVHPTLVLAPSLEEGRAAPLILAESLSDQGRPLEALQSLSSYRSTSFSAKALAKKLEARLQVEHSRLALGLVQAFFTDSDRGSIPEAFRNLGEGLKDGRTLQAAFQGLNAKDQNEIQARIGETYLRQIISISQNTEPQAFWTEALDFGVQLKQNLELEKSAALLSFLDQDQVPDPLRKKANQELNAILGKGSSGLRSEVLFATTFHEASNYKTVIPMLLASVAGQVASTATLGRIASMGREGWIGSGLGARVVAGSMGFLAEFPTFALANRAFQGDRGKSLGDDMARSAITLGALRLFGWMGEQTFLKIQGFNELGIPTRLTGLAKFNQIALPQFFTFAGLLFAHKLEEKVKLRDQVDDATTVSDTIASMVSMSAGSGIGHVVLGEGFANFRREMGLRADIYSKFGDPTPPKKGTENATWVHAKMAGNPLLGSVGMIMSASVLGGGNGSGRPPPSFFRVGEENSSQLIRRLRQIEGRPISAIEAKMRDAPNAQSFLGGLESLLELMATDNDYVLSQGMGHQEIAATLQSLSKIQGHFAVRGQVFTSRVHDTEEYLDSPFQDGVKSTLEIILTNLTLQKSLRFSELMPDLIARYGFYGGKATPNRLEPSQILELFGSLREQEEAVIHEGRLTIPGDDTGRLTLDAIPAFVGGEIREQAIKDRTTITALADEFRTSDDAEMQAQVREVLLAARSSHPDALSLVLGKMSEKSSWGDSLKERFSIYGNTLGLAENGSGDAQIQLADLATRDEALSYYVLLNAVAGQHWTVPALSKMISDYPVAKMVLKDMASRPQSTDAVFSWAMVGDLHCQAALETAAKKSPAILGDLLSLSRKGEIWAQWAVERLMEASAKEYKPSWIPEKKEPEPSLENDADGKQRVTLDALDVEGERAALLPHAKGDSEKPSGDL